MHEHARVQVAVVDYGMGNLGSVLSAFEALDIPASAASPSDLGDATHVILPGVGAFGDGMARLRGQGWVDPLEEAVFSRRLPLLGICLGMQLLMAVGTEHGEHKGLGWIDGDVVRLPADVGLRIPHIGWNDVHRPGSSPLFEGIPNPAAFYFVHSYAVRPSDPAVAAAVTDHGVEFVSSLRHGNIFGVQFHPEKSHRAGLRLLRNFATVDATRC